MKYTSRGLRRRGETDQWEVTLSHKNPVTGEVERTFRTITAKTKRQAERERDKLIMELELNGMSFNSALTVREFMGKWMEYKAASKAIEPSTVRGYKGDIKLMCKYIGEVPLCDVNVGTIERWMGEMNDDGYAPKSVVKCFMLLKQAMKFAVAQDLIAKNPCEFCKPPKRVKPKINALPASERRRMLSIARQAQPGQLAMAIELALTTGMRRGEICALRWSDIGEDQTITVNRALGNGEGGFYVKEPKTAGSRRTIPLTTYTYRVLMANKKDIERTCKRFAMAFDDPYILGTFGEESRPYNPTQLGKDFTAFCKMNGFDCTFHDLRHTFATYMIAAGVDVRTVASYLGHASVSMTLNTYADVDPDAKRAAVKRIEEAFEGVGPFDFHRYEEEAEPALTPEKAAATFTAAELRKMLEIAEAREAMDRMAM